MTKKVDPYYGGQYSKDKIVLHGVRCGEICVSGNDPVTPARLMEWLRKFETKGWTNLRIRTYTDEGGPDNLDSHYIEIRGDRRETDKEFKHRQEWIISNWQREYEEYLYNKALYETNPIGLARVAEVHKKAKRPIVAN